MSEVHFLCNYLTFSVAGDPGLMGGKLSHEFHIVADVGEDKLIVCSQ